MRLMIESYYFLWTAGRVLLLGHVILVVMMDSLRNLKKWEKFKLVSLSCFNSF